MTAETGLEYAGFFGICPPICTPGALKWAKVRAFEERINRLPSLYSSSPAQVMAHEQT
jgi:hypothetical protein